MKIKMVENGEDNGGRGVDEVEEDWGGEDGGRRGGEKEEMDKEEGGKRRKRWRGRVRRWRRMRKTWGMR